MEGLTGENVSFEVLVAGERLSTVGTEWHFTGGMHDAEKPTWGLPGVLWAKWLGGVGNVLVPDGAETLLLLGDDYEGSPSKRIITMQILPNEGKALRHPEQVMLSDGHRHARLRHATRKVHVARQAWRGWPTAVHGTFPE